MAIYNLQINEIIAFGDSPSASLLVNNLAIFVSGDSLSLSDDGSSQFAAFKFPTSDQLVFSEGLEFFGVEEGLSVGDSFVLGDTASAAYFVSSFLSADSLSLSDSVVALLQFDNFSDSLSFSDNLSTSIFITFRALTWFVSDSITIADGVESGDVERKSATDSLQFLDFVAPLLKSTTLGYLRRYLNDVSGPPTLPLFSAATSNPNPGGPNSGPGGLSVNWVQALNTPDGVTTVFLFPFAPKYISWNGVNQFENVGYQIIGQSGNNYQVQFIGQNGVLTPGVGDDIREETN